MVNFILKDRHLFLQKGTEDIEYRVQENKNIIIDNKIKYDKNIVNT